MKSTAYIFPQAAPGEALAANLAPWFDSLRCIAPDSLKPEEETGLVETITPELHDAQSAKRMEIMLEQWKSWVESNRATGRVESAQLGIDPEPAKETARTLLGELKRMGDDEDPGDQPNPAAKAELLLHLAHLQDQHQSELDGALKNFEAKADALDEAMADATRTDKAAYSDVQLKALPPLEYDQADEARYNQRLKAWGTLGVNMVEPGSWLVSDMPLVAAMLAEKLADHGAELLPTPGEVMRQAAFATPDLSCLEPGQVEEMLDAKAAELEPLRKRLNSILLVFGQGGSYTEAAQSLAHLGDDMCALFGDVCGGNISEVSVCLLSGADLAGVLNLMAGTAAAPSTQTAFPLLIA